MGGHIGQTGRMMEMCSDGLSSAVGKVLPVLKYDYSIKMMQILAFFENIFI